MEDKQKPWVDGPFQMIKPSRSGAEVCQSRSLRDDYVLMILIDVQIGKQLGPARALAAEMTVVHNGLMRGINAVYNQAINVANKGTHQDKVDFANFAAQCAKLLHMHHDHEEEILFPTMGELAGEPGLMDANVAEHAAFHDGFEKYEQYLTSVKEEKVELDGEHLRGLIDAFMPPLYTHLQNEVDTLVALEKYDDKVNWIEWFNSEIEKWNKVLMKQSEFRVCGSSNEVGCDANALSRHRSSRSIASCTTRATRTGSGVISRPCRGCC